VGLDSAEPTLVRELIDRGELPTLAGLLDRGQWALVDSRADIGSGSVWPTFFTGSDPREHGRYSGWVWKPEAMACVTAYEDFDTPPFWNALQASGESVGLLDVPLLPFAGAEPGFEVSAWGPHDVVLETTQHSPSRASEIVTRNGPHPFAHLYYGPGRLEDHEGRRRLAAACVAGARLRGEAAVNLISEFDPALTIVAFTEIHHTTHQLWHTIAPEHRLYADPRFRRAEGVRPGLIELYREVDRQVGRVIEAAAQDTAVMVFSLHGMEPAPGIPTILEPLLTSLGFARPMRWSGLSWRERAAAAFGAAKRRAPERLKRLYNRTTTDKARHLIAQPTMVPPHDWSRTRAFALPTDQHGFVRLNVAGREAAGIVPEPDYEAVRDQLAETLQAITTVDGEPLVRDVLRTSEGTGELPRTLPDLIVHWDDAAFDRPTRVATGSMEIEADPIRPDLTGHHAPHGFCILDERLANGSVRELIAGKDLSRLLLSTLGARSAGAPA
jgi:predicted AlkP superfamily phosphohydrolase/phosphomutase